MRCAFCKNNKLINPIVKYSPIRKIDVNYYHCSFCDSIHQVPEPDSNIIKDYYESYIGIKKRMNPGYLDDNNMKSFFKERDLTLNEIGFNKKLFKNALNVEVGCANGHFLRYMQENGAKNIIGIDISQSLLASINIKNVKTFAGDLSKLNKNSIDNLFLFNILEHVTDIDYLMNLIITRLKKNGWLVIEVPLAGVISKFFAKKWRFLMPDEHLHIPSLKGLKILLNNYGLNIIGQIRFGSGYTSGIIPIFFKKKFDLIAKTFSFGDRAAFLISFIE